MAPSTAPRRPTGYLMTKVAQATSARFAEALAPLHIRPKHYGVLMALAWQPHGSQQQLGKALGVVPSAVVGMLDDLEALGAIVRTQAPNDRRHFVVELTPAGTQLLQDAGRAGAQVDAEVLAGLTAAEQETLQALLERVAARLDPAAGGDNPRG